MEVRVSFHAAATLSAERAPGCRVGGWVTLSAGLDTVAKILILCP
jgi:hypothetical protein